MRDPSYVFIFFFVDSVLCVPVCFLVSSERLPATRQPNRTDPVIDAGFLLPRLNFFVLWRRRPKKTFLARPSIRNHNWLYNNNNNWCSSHSVWQIKKNKKNTKNTKHKTKKYTTVIESQQPRQKVIIQRKNDIIITLAVVKGTQILWKAENWGQQQQVCLIVCLPIHRERRLQVTCDE